MVINALQAYQRESKPTALVSKLADQAMMAMRNLILPVIINPGMTKSSSPKLISKATKQPLGRTKVTAPAIKQSKPSRTVSETKSKSITSQAQPVTPKNRKISQPSLTPSKSVSKILSTSLNNLPTLLKALSSLISLLGILALPLQKIEALKIARALLRGNDEYVAEYTALTGKLAIEYSALGKYDRATEVLQQALKNLESNKREIGGNVKIEFYLRWSMAAAEMGELDNA